MRYINQGIPALWTFIRYINQGIHALWTFMPYINHGIHTIGDSTAHDDWAFPTI